MPEKFPIIYQKPANKPKQRSLRGEKELIKSPETEIIKQERGVIRAEKRAAKAKEEFIKEKINDILRYLEVGQVNYAKKILKQSKIKKEEFLKPNIQKRVKAIIESSVFGGYFETSRLIIQEFPIDKNILTSIFEKFSGYLSETFLSARKYAIDNLKIIFRAQPFLLQNPKIQAGFDKYLLYLWSTEAELHFAIEFQKAFIPKERMYELAKRFIDAHLSEDIADLQLLFDFLTAMRLPRNILQSLQVRAKDLFLKILNEGDIQYFLLEDFGFSVKDSELKTVIIKNLYNSGFLDDLSQNQLLEKPMKLILNDPLVRKKAAQILLRIIKDAVWVHSNTPDTVFVYQTIFNFKPEELDNEPKLIIKTFVNTKRFSQAALFIRLFYPGQKITVPEKILSDLENYVVANPHVFNDSIKFFNLPANYPKQLSKKVLLSNFAARKNKHIFFEIFNELHANFPGFLTSDELMQSSNSLFFILEEAKKISPEVYSRFMNSPEILAELHYNLTKDKFNELIGSGVLATLLGALAANPRFGARLFEKFSDFHDDSQLKISELYKFKKSILEDRKGINPHSKDFRMAMQEKLLTFKNNKEIIQAIKDKGIDIDNWLNYDKSRDLYLKSKGREKFMGEALQASMHRLLNAVRFYFDQCKEALSDYQEEIANQKILLENPQVVIDQIERLKSEMEKAKQEGQDKKVEGMGRGLESLKSKLANIKSVSLWNSYMGDLSAILALSHSAQNDFNSLSEAEEKLRDYIAQGGYSKEEFKSKKQAILDFKSSLKTKLEIIKRRTADFDSRLLKELPGFLGQDRAEGVLGQIRLAFDEDKLVSDLDMDGIKKIFDEYEAEESKFKNHPMTISVWDRNPDTDLYQGNYSPCCISVENGTPINSKTSTIANYLTDLGIQIVNISDSLKNEPVAAAWCWIGQNEKKETALIVDNIEANPSYISENSYVQLMGEELLKYLIDYAQAIGVQKLVLGNSHNDLPSENRLKRFKSDWLAHYFKLGEFNGAPYYLEAHDSLVKLIWKKK